MLAHSQHTQQQEKTFQLTDTGFEHAAIIRIFLNLITFQNDRLPFTSPHRKWRADLKSLLYFLDKYDSQLALKQLRLYGAELVLHDSIASVNAAVFASMTNDVAL